MTSLCTLNRRAMLRAAAGAPLAMGSGGILAAARPEASSASITAMFERWADLRFADTAAMDEAERHGLFSDYRALQDAITSATPTSARDVAMMLVAETDAGESEMTDEFFARMTALARPADGL